MSIAKGFILVVFVVQSSILAANGALLVIKNPQVVLGVSTRLGGRVVVFKRPGGQNVLKCDPLAWNEPEKNVPKLIRNSIFKEYNGHIVWVAPQRNWWMNQRFDLNRRKRRAAWPPDPFILYGRCEVLLKTTDTLILETPKSPVSGIQFRKTFKIYDNGKALLTVVMKNSSNESREWGIWSNTRFNGDVDFLASIDPKKGLRIQGRYGNPAHEAGLEFSVEDGFFRFLKPTRWPQGITRKYSKAGFSSKRGVFFVFTDKDMFVKRFPVLSASVVASGHAPVEVFLRLGGNAGKSDLLELENHSECVILKPGERFSYRELWDLSHRPTPQNNKERIEMACEYMRHHDIENTEILNVSASAPSGR